MTAALDLALIDGPVRLTGAPAGLPRSHAEHVATLPPMSLTGADLVAALEAVALTGRGGGHFPVPRKWRAVRAAGTPAVVVANGAESEPASAKDAVLLQQRPHLVLDGLLAAADTLAAHDVVIWLHDGATATRAAVGRALAERPDSGRIRVACGPDRYLSGESSAIVRALSGGPALPAYRTVPTAQHGVGTRPTLVQNVESLARVGLFARLGVVGHRRTALLTVTTSAGRAVLEADLAASPAAVLQWVAPGLPDPAAVLLGGYGGRWLRWSLVAHRPLAELGPDLGAGVVVALSEGHCGLAAAAALARYLAGQGARQCGPCGFGLDALVGALDTLVVGRAPRAVLDRLAVIAGQVEGRGACHHPDGAVRMVRSALRAFADDAAAHAAGHPCPGSRAPLPNLPGITS
jgi:NADH:ubiquinone oxidoreductase subunit F (NADH-binding)